MKKIANAIMAIMVLFAAICIFYAVIIAISKLF